MSVKQSVKDIYQAVGGDGNIVSLTHCVTRLRFKLKDEGKVDDDQVKNIPGVMGVNHQSGQYQVIIGNAVSDYYKEITKLGNFNTGEGKEVPQEKGSLFDRFANFISSCMSPLIPALIGGGMIKVILIILTTLDILSTKGQTYTILSAFGDAPFYFLPVELAYTASKYFKVNTMLAVSLAGILIHPNFIGLVDAHKPIFLMGLPVTAASYSSSVIPILLIVWAMKYIEGGIDKVCPASLKSILKPLLELFIMGVLALVIIGPIGTYAGDLLSAIILFVQSRASWLAMALMAAFMPVIVMTGMHWAFAPIFLAASIAHPDSLILPAMLVANVGQGAAALAVAIKSKNKNTKQVATAASISALLAGVTEPALYGVTLKYKKPLYASMISGGIIGFFVGIIKLKAYAFAVPAFIALPQFINNANKMNFTYAVITAVASLVLTFILTYIIGFDEEKPKEETKKADVSNLSEGANETKKVYAPVAGEMISLESVSDKVFADKIMGDGVAIIPSDNKIYAPFDGVVTTIFPTKHAIGLKSNTGVELLIHIGLNTVELDGKPFTEYVKVNQKVRKGDLLLEVDLDAINKAGLETVTPIVVTNSKEFVEVVPSDKIVVDNNSKIMYIV